MRLQKTILVVGIALFSVMLAKGQPNYYQQIKQYSDSLYQSFDPLQKRSALLSFNDTARIKWNNLPVGLRARAGSSIGNMSVEQRKFVHRILSASLSSQGYLKATGIMHLDNLLNWYYDTLHYRNAITDSEYQEVRALQWSHKNYYFAFFGKPGDSTWGYKLEGHHLSVNFTFTGQKISVTPLFVGTDPAEYDISEYAGWRILGQEEDLGMQLINMLSPSQQKKATLSQKVPEDVITSAESGKRLVDYWGIKAAELTKQQKDLLQSIIREFVFNLEYEKAMTEYEKIIKAGIDNIYFGWIGSYKEHENYYYIVNGPGFLIEFDNRNKGNHVHAIWREKGNEFGEDVLKQHYLKEKH